MDEFWVPWEPPDWISARGPSLLVESEHFCVRWGADTPASDRAAALAPVLLVWLEECFALLCDPSSPDCFVVPYCTAHWSDDGLRRKLNVYIGMTGLDPYPQQGGAYAHQGTWVEQPVEAVRHALSKCVAPQGQSIDLPCLAITTRLDSTRSTRLDSIRFDSTRLHSNRSDSTRLGKCVSLQMRLRIQLRIRVRTSGLCVSPLAIHTYMCTL